MGMRSFQVGLADALVEIHPLLLEAIQDAIGQHDTLARYI
jgi:hypothetical protein